jgi:RNA polymerase sigma-70 factor (ECF subfamily)
MDAPTFARVAEEYAARLYAVAYRMPGSRPDAEDAVQRALLKCFAARATYSPRWAISTWLYRALANVKSQLARGKAILRRVLGP